MSKKIIYLLFPMMVLGLMAAPALAATPDHLNLENSLALSSQSRMADSCPAAADLPGNAFILAKGGKSGSSGGSNSSGSNSSGSNSSGSNSSGSSGGNSDGDCCDNGPQGGQGPKEDEDAPHRYQYQYRWSFQNQEQHNHQEQYGPGDGEGNDGEGPQDGSGYGAPVNR